MKAEMRNSTPGTVVISGASTGIGRATALWLDGRGYQVFAGVRKEADAASLREAASDRLTPLFLEVTDEKSIAAAAEAVAASVGDAGLRGVVNNAGVPLGGPLEFIDLDKFRYQMEVNFFGGLAMIQAFMPLLRAARGRIVNITSGSGLVSLPFGGSYAATKYAMEAASDALRVELRPWDIKVVVIEPGDVDTHVWGKAAAVVDETARNFSPRAMELYGPVVALRDRFRPHGIPPQRVARLIEKALTTRRPRARYKIGTDVHITSLLRFFPTSLRDWIISRFLPEYG